MPADEPELLVPLSEARRQAPPARGRGFVVLTRIWIVLALVAAWFVFAGDSQSVNFKGALITLAVFAIVWNIVAWIFRPTLPPEDEQR